MSLTTFELANGPAVTVDVESEFFKEIFTPGSGREGINADGTVTAAADVTSGEILQAAEQVRRQSEYALAAGSVAVQNA